MQLYNCQNNILIIRDKTMANKLMYIPYDEKQIYLFSSADWKCELKSLNTSNHPKSMKDTQSFWANVDIKLWVPVFIWWTLEGSMHLETYSAPYNCGVKHPFGRKTTNPLIARPLYGSPNCVFSKSLVWRGVVQT